MTDSPTSSAAAIVAAVNRHTRIAFQFSGGRDSTAALYLLRPLWPAMTVYHIDAGDQFPETRAVVERVNLDVPITVIHTDSKAVRAQHGLPSDLVPIDNTPVGRLLSNRTILIQSRLECCSRSLMVPMHERMLADGMTLLIRGVRAEEFPGGLPAASGYRDENIELLYPIEDWSEADVMDFITEQGLPIAPFYAEEMKQAPECMGCTAWWNEGRSSYMRLNHPDAYRAVRPQLLAVRAEIESQLAQLDDLPQGD